MNITAITRFKHGDIYRLLKELGWTQCELAKRTGITPTTIGLIINLRKRPCRKHADAIQSAMAAEGEYLDIMAEWPELFEGLMKPPVIEQTIDVDVLALEANPDVLQISGPNDMAALDVKEQVEHHISKLPQKESKLARAMFIDELDDEEVAGRFGMGKPLVNHVRNCLKRKLKRAMRDDDKQDYSHNRMLHMIKNGEMQYRPNDGGVP